MSSEIDTDRLMKAMRGAIRDEARVSATAWLQNHLNGIARAVADQLRPPADAPCPFCGRGGK